MGAFPNKVRSKVIQLLNRRGVEIYEYASVAEIRNGKIILDSGKGYASDYVFIATGVKPSAIFKESRLPVGIDGGLPVNKYLHMDEFPEVFGGGDCIYFKKKALNKVLKDIESFDELCSTNRDFVLMLKNPIINHWHKLTILKKIFEGKIDKLTMSLFEIITRKNREKYLPETAKAFLHQYNEVNGIVESTVTTVAPLTAPIRKEITALLDKLTNKKKIQLTEIVEPNLIGGFVLKIGDKQLDESVSSKLRELKLQFQQG